MDIKIAVVSAYILINIIFCKAGYDCNYNDDRNYDELSIIN